MPNGFAVMIFKCYNRKPITPLPKIIYLRFRDDAPRYDAGLTGDSMSFR